MHTRDILFYGHRWVLRHIDGLSESELLTPDVCGVWSSKDILAHLASFEQALSELFNSLTSPAARTPTLEKFYSMDQDDFNAEQVGLRKEHSVSEVRSEYTRLAEQNIEVSARIPNDTLTKTGLLEWYGTEYDLEDFLVYTFYGHKREHMAQVAIFRDTLKKKVKR